MERDAERGVDWVHLPVIATVTRLLCRELTLQNEYLLLENRTFKSKVPGRLRFTDEERRCLSEAALAMGRSLMKEVVGIVKPETILAWQRRLERRKWAKCSKTNLCPWRSQEGPWSTDFCVQGGVDFQARVRHPPDLIWHVMLMLFSPLCLMFGLVLRSERVP